MKTASTAHTLFPTNDQSTANIAILKKGLNAHEKARILFFAGFRVCAVNQVIAENVDVVAAVLGARNADQRYGASFKGRTAWLFQPSRELVAELQTLQEMDQADKVLGLLQSK